MGAVWFPIFTIVFSLTFLISLITPTTFEAQILLVAEELGTLTTDPLATASSQRWSMVLSVITGATLLISVGFLSAISNKLGRKKTLFIALSGLFFIISGWSLIYTVKSLRPYWRGITAVMYFLNALSGTAIIAAVAIFGQCGDLTDHNPRVRSSLFVLVECVAGFTGLLGTQVSGLLNENHMNIVFIMSFTGICLLLLFVIFILPETIDPKLQRQPVNWKSANTLKMLSFCLNSKTTRDALDEDAMYIYRKRLEKRYNVDIPENISLPHDGIAARHMIMEALAVNSENSTIDSLEGLNNNSIRLKQTSINANALQRHIDGHIADGDVFLPDLPDVNDNNNTNNPTNTSNPEKYSDLDLEKTTINPENLDSSQYSEITKSTGDNAEKSIELGSVVKIPNSTKNDFSILVETPYNGEGLGRGIIHNYIPHTNALTILTIFLFISTITGVMYKAIQFNYMRQIYAVSPYLFSVVLSVEFAGKGIGVLLILPLISHLISTPYSEFILIACLSCVQGLLFFTMASSSQYWPFVIANSFQSMVNTLIGGINRSLFSYQVSNRLQKDYLGLIAVVEVFSIIIGGFSSGFLFSFTNQHIPSLVLWVIGTCLILELIMPFLLKDSKMNFNLRTDHQQEASLWTILRRRNQFDLDGSDWSNSDQIAAVISAQPKHSQTAKIQNSKNSVFNENDGDLLSDSTSPKTSKNGLIGSHHNDSSENEDKGAMNSDLTDINHV